MLTELGNYTNSENFSKELENLKKNQSDLKNTIIEIKKKKKNNTLEGINILRLGDTKECVSNLEDRLTEITQSEKQKEKQTY